MDRVYCRYPTKVLTKSYYTVIKETDNQYKVQSEITGNYHWINKRRFEVKG